MANNVLDRSKRFAAFRTPEAKRKFFEGGQKDRAGIIGQFGTFREAQEAERQVRGAERGARGLVQRPGTAPARDATREAALGGIAKLVTPPLLRGIGAAREALQRPRVPTFGVPETSEEAIRRSVEEAVAPGIEEIGRQRAELLEPEEERAEQLRLQREQRGRLPEIEELAERQRAATQARIQSQLAESQAQAQRQQEQIATRFAVTGFGRSTEQVQAQADLARSVANIQNQIRQQGELQLARIDAEERGASGDELERLDTAIAEQQERISGLQAQFAEQEAGLRTGAIEAGEAGLARFAEQQQLREQTFIEEQAARRAQQAQQQKARADFLETQGLVQDPDTGELVQDIRARADLLEQQSQVELRRAQAQRALRPEARRFIPGTARQLPGTFDPTTGQFIPMPEAGRAAVIGRAGAAVAATPTELGFDPNKAGTYNQILSIADREGIETSEAAKKLGFTREQAVQAGIESTNFAVEIERQQAAQEAAAEAEQEAIRAQRPITRAEAIGEAARGAVPSLRQVPAVPFVPGAPTIGEVGAGIAGAGRAGLGFLRGFFR